MPPDEMLPGLELDEYFAYAGWDALDLTDVYLVIDDALDYMDESGYL